MDFRNSENLSSEAVKLLLEKQGLNVRLYDLREREAITDYYINVTGKSNMHVTSLSDDLTDHISELGRDALRTEGRQTGAWVLVDYGDVIINIFDKQSRDFYDLDRLMPKGSEVDITPLIEEVDSKFAIKNN